MSDRTLSRKGSRKRPLIERRVAPTTTAPDDAADALRKVKGALNRPLVLERRDGHLRLVLLERRRTPPADQAPVLAKIRAELRERLWDLTDTPAGRMMRHLSVVSTELDRKGWPGVEALPAAVLSKALVQAEILASEEPSHAWSVFIDRLRLLGATARVRDERRSSRVQSVEEEEATLVVSEATHEEFEASERIWADSFLSGLPALPDSDASEPH